MTFGVAPVCSYIKMYTAIFRMFNRTERSGSLIHHFVVNLTDTTASRCTVSVANGILWGEFVTVGPNLCTPTACRSMQGVLPKKKVCWYEEIRRDNW